MIPSIQRHRAGASLLVVMLFISIATILVGSVVMLTQNSARLSVRSRAMTSAGYAAEGLIEKAYFIWQKRMVSSPTGRLTNAQLKEAIVLNDLIPSTAENDSLAGFTYPADVNGVSNLSICALAADGSQITDPNGVPDGVQINDNGTPAVVYRYRIVAFAKVKAVGPNPITVGVERTFTRRDDSLSVGVFLQDSAGIHPGDKLIFDQNCQVHSNGTLYVAAYNSVKNSLIQFLGPVSYAKGYVEGFPPGEIVAGTVPKAPVWNDGKAYSDSTTRPSQLRESLPLKPAGIDATSVSTGNTNTGDGYREIVKIPDAGADPYASVRLYNQADIIILLNDTYDSAGNATPSITVKGAGGASLPDSTASAIQDALVDPATGKLDRTVIYDRREQGEVEVTSLHIDKLGDAIAKRLSTFNGILYIADLTQSPSGRKTAIRLLNGARLPGSENGSASNGFTIASQNALYIQGDYNTDSRLRSGVYDPTALPSNTSISGNPETMPNAHIPASIMADAVTLLSNNWNDGRSYNYEPTDRPASSTTVEASIVAGVSLAGSASDPYIQGGAHNIVRLMEDWSSSTLTLNGSLTELYVSKAFTGPWAVYPNYNPGSRRVLYDATLRQKRPPGQPPISTFMRGEWRRL